MSLNINQINQEIDQTIKDAPAKNIKAAGLRTILKSVTTYLYDQTQELLKYNNFKPFHRWTDGTRLELQNPDGSFAPGVDLQGYAPVFGLAVDGERLCLVVTDWAAGNGPKPATGQFLGLYGLVNDITRALNVRGGQGVTGPQGSLFYSGSTNPVANQIGKAQDYYINTVSGEIFYQLGSGRWESKGNIKGPQGIQGVQGNQGIPGNQGGPGPANTLTIKTITTTAAGTQATAVITGSSPAQEISFTIPKGDQGIQGIQGNQGATGARGSYWTSGTANPTAGSNGVPKDLYLNSITYELFQMADAGTWTSLGVLKGTAGSAAYTRATANFTNPAIGSTVNIPVGDALWMAPGMVIYAFNVQTGSRIGYYKVANINSATSVTLTLTDYVTPSNGGNAGAMLVAAGERGATGADGTGGSGSGSQGPQGPQGPQGIQGVAGTNGKTVLSGTSAPNNSTGTDGDFFINTSSSMIYGPKASGSWPAGTSLVGPKGADGVAGGASGKGFTNDGYTTTGKYITLEQTGDDGGGSKLSLINRGGQNGPLFEATGGNDLIDFGFKTPTGKKGNIRYEGRTEAGTDGTGTWTFSAGGNAASQPTLEIFGTKVVSLKPLTVPSLVFGDGTSMSTAPSAGGGGGGSSVGSFYETVTPTTVAQLNTAIANCTKPVLYVIGSALSMTEMIVINNRSNLKIMAHNMDLTLNSWNSGVQGIMFDLQGTLKNVTIEGFRLNCPLPSSSGGGDGGGYGMIIARGAIVNSITGLTIQNCHFTSPDLHMNAISLICVGWGGTSTIQNVLVRNCTAENVKRMFFECTNQQAESNGQYMTNGTVRYRNITVENCYARNLGGNGVNTSGGMMVSFDGPGDNIEVKSNTVINPYFAAYEAVGINNVRFTNNVADYEEGYSANFVGYSFTDGQHGSQFGPTRVRVTGGRVRCTGRSFNLTNGGKNTFENVSMISRQGNTIVNSSENEFRKCSIVGKATNEFLIALQQTAQKNVLTDCYLGNEGSNDGSGGRCNLVLFDGACINNRFVYLNHYQEKRTNNNDWYEPTILDFSSNKASNEVLYNRTNNPSLSN